MRRANETATGVIIGAILGAGVTLLLIPSARRALVRRVSSLIPEAEDELDFDGIAQEAGASEGGLAATRTWRSGYPAAP